MLANMKKIIITVAACSLILTSCTSSVAKKAAEETKLAIADGDYTSALSHAELAIKEGYDKDEFLNLKNLVKCYIDERSALDAMDPDKSEEIIQSAGSYEGSGMSAIVDELKKSISKIKEDAKEYEDDIEDIEQSIEKEYYYSVSSDAEDLLKEDLTKSQRERVEKLYDTAEQKKKEPKATATPQPATSPKAILTEDEAIEIARADLHASSDADVSIELKGDYYQVIFTSRYVIDGQIEYDGVACKVDAKTGRVYDQAG